MDQFGPWLSQTPEYRVFQPYRIQPVGPDIVYTSPFCMRLRQLQSDWAKWSRALYLLPMGINHSNHCSKVRRSGSMFLLASDLVWLYDVFLEAMPLCLCVSALHCGRMGD
jgi:hypothetical protein